MTSTQDLESYLPVYDTVPDKWEDAKPFFVEQLKKISNAVNIREIGWAIDDEVISGKQFIPLYGGSGQNADYRTVFRKVVDCSPLSVGANIFPHGIDFTATSRFSLVQLFGAATVDATLEAIPLPNNIDSLTIDTTDILINVAAAYDRAFVTIEYIKEL